MGATNCKCNALVLGICLSVAMRICGKRQEGFLTLQPLLSFAQPPQPGLQQGLTGRSRLSRL